MTKICGLAFVARWRVGCVIALDVAAEWRHSATMTTNRTRPRRRRLSVDLPPDTESATRAIADRYFRGVTTDVIRASLSLLSWVIESKREGKKVGAVRRDRVPDQFEEVILPGLEEQLTVDATWLVNRPHEWRRQPWVKGRRITAGDLARAVEIEGWSTQEAAAQYDVPVEAILEAQRFLAQNRDLVLAEERENALAAQRGTAAPS